MVAVVCGIGCVLVVSSAIWSFAALGGISTPIVLHFNSTDGITQIGSRFDLVGFGIFALCVIGFNSAIALLLNDRDPEVVVEREHGLILARARYAAPISTTSKWTETISNGSK